MIHEEKKMHEVVFEVLHVFILFSQLNGQTQNSFSILKAFHCLQGSVVVYRKYEVNLIP